MTLSPSIGVIGTGIIGLSCALELRRRGADVTLYQSAQPPPASLVAAGLLGPGFELGLHQDAHPQLARLCMLSAKLWPDFAAALKTGDDDPVPDEAGTLICISGQMDLSALQRLSRSCLLYGLEHTMLSPEQARKREPSLQTQQNVLCIPGDTQTDSSTILACLRKSLIRLEVPFRQTSPIRVLERRAGGGLLIPGHGEHEALLLATGAAARFPMQIDGEKIRCVSEGAIFPVKGEILAVQGIRNAPRHVIRSGSLYIAPKADRILIGASSYKDRDDREVDREVLQKLRRSAEVLCPGLESAENIAWQAGIRPGSIDHAPFLGKSPVRGIYVASGHYRNGILLAPVSARIMAGIILEQDFSGLAGVFDPFRARKA